jgi:hypothetical protein
MNRLLTLILLSTAIFVYPSSTPSAVERFDLLAAIAKADSAAVQNYCAQDRSLDVSRTLSTQDTAVHVAIRALIAEYEKQSNSDRMLNNLGVWLFSGSVTAFLAHYYWPTMRDQLLQADTLVGTSAVGLKNLASLSSNVLLLGTMGGIIGWSLKNIVKNGRGIVRNWSHAKVAQERLKIVELLLAHQSFNPTATNTDGQTPLVMLQTERERLDPEKALHKVLQTLETKLVVPAV